MKLTDAIEVLRGFTTDQTLLEIADMLERMDWQPVETAPRDGTEIIGVGVMPAKRGGMFQRKDPEPFVGTVWYLSNLWQAGRLDDCPEITRWMHLPTLPEGQSDE